MHKAYEKLLSSPVGDKNLTDIAESICADLDRLLVEKIWPAEEKEQRRRQAAEMSRPGKKHNPVH